MSANRPIVLTIAGFDPCGGAGILADCKTFESLKTYGLAIPTANTLQTEHRFFWIHWQDMDVVLESLQLMLVTYPIKVIKIGIIPDFDYILKIVYHIKTHDSTIKIVWDPVLKATTNFSFMDIPILNNFYKVLGFIDLITPNVDEINVLQPEAIEIIEKAKKLGKYTTILLKGGHAEQEIGLDYLIHQREIHCLKPTKKSVYAKHGTGCVLSAAITANLAKGMDILTACRQAKLYIENFIESNTSLLGYHD